MQLKNIPEGTPRREKVVAHLNQLKKKAVLNAKIQAETDAVNLKIARQSYAKILRNKYLDDGMDIKVSTTGKSSTRLNLSYPLFNDVWVHKYQNGNIMNEIRAMGFKQVGFSDNHDYNVVLTFK